jgi:hypothetical protein
MKSANTKSLSAVARQMSTAPLPARSSSAPEAERSAFLDSACDGDAELRAEVDRLLEEGHDPSLHSPASGILSAIELAPGDAWGNETGLWRIRPLSPRARSSANIESTPPSAKAEWA